MNVMLNLFKVSINDTRTTLVFLFYFSILTFLWRSSLSYRNQSIDLQSKSRDWFLYDMDFGHERANVNFEFMYLGNSHINLTCIFTTLNRYSGIFLSNYNLGRKVRRIFSVPPPFFSPLFSVEECEKKIKSERASFSVYITDISTLNKGDPKKSSQPFVQDCTTTQPALLTKRRLAK